MLLSRFADFRMHKNGNVFCGGRTVRLAVVPIFFFLFLGMGSMAGQSDPSTSLDWEQGFKQYGSYHGGDLDKISLTNQNLFFKADLFAYSQRSGELAYPVSIQYNSKALTQFQQSTCPPGTPPSELHTCLMFYTVWGAPWNGGKISNGNSVMVGFGGGGLGGLPYVVSTSPPVGIDTTLTLNSMHIFKQTSSALTPDGALHQLVSNGNTQVATDGSGFFVDGNGVLHDGKGNIYNAFAAILRKRSGPGTLIRSRNTRDRNRRRGAMGNRAHWEGGPRNSKSSRTL